MNPLMSPVKSGLPAMISVSVALSVPCFLKVDVSDARDLTEPCKEKTPDGVQAAWRRALWRQHSEPVSSADFGTSKAKQDRQEGCVVIPFKIRCEASSECFSPSGRGIRNDLSGGFRELG